jgi:antitoxin YefM
MRTLALSEAKAHLSQLVDDVLTRDEQVTITRHGQPVAMLVRPDAFESWEATLEIMRDPEMMAGIRQGLKDLEEGRVVSGEEMDAILDEVEKAEAEGREPVIVWPWERPK